MKLELKRIHLDPGYTIGELRVDGSRVCYTLEDAVRERPGQSVSAWKIQNETAIPAGTYEVIINRSNRFRRNLPLLLEVPGFAGVRIHPGNSSANTEGCILVGRDWGGGDWISQSRAAFEPLFAQLLGAWHRGDRITLEIIP